MFTQPMRKHSLRQTVNQYLTDNRSGCTRDKNQRRHVLHKLIDDLYMVGNVPPTWKHLKTEHISQVIKLWRKQKLKQSTVINYMTVIRAFITTIGQPIEKIDNQSLGLYKKKPTSKALYLTQDVCHQLQSEVSTLLMSLQVHFGLTLSESMRIHPGIHIQDSQLWLTRDITFNGHDRAIPIVTHEQKSALKNLQQLTKGKECIIVAEGYHALLQAWKNELKELKLPTRKSYRHLYAQSRKNQLGGKLTHYKMHLTIMDEMGITSRTTLWKYLSE